jgi:hypothetical protein
MSSSITASSPPASRKTFVAPASRRLFSGVPTPATAGRRPPYERVPRYAPSSRTKSRALCAKNLSSPAEPGPSLLVEALCTDSAKVVSTRGAPPRPESASGERRVAALFEASHAGVTVSTRPSRSRHSERAFRAKNLSSLAEPGPLPLLHSLSHLPDSPDRKIASIARIFRSESSSGTATSPPSRIAREKRSP